jgi:hypothetical protein
MTPKYLYFFFLYQYQKYTEFYAFKSVEIILKKCLQKKVIGPKLLQVRSIEKDKLQFCTLFLPIIFCLQISGVF